MRSDPNGITLFEAALRPHVAGGMSLDAVYRATEVSKTVITDSDRPWSLATDDDLITIWHALNVKPAHPRATDLRKRIESEMMRDRGIDDDRRRDIDEARLWRDWR
jgi:hypothetical protein